MTGPEVMRAFNHWWLETRQGRTGLHPPLYPAAYPLYIAANGPYAGRWYVRERFPGTRVWRAEEDGSFMLLAHPPLGMEARR